MKKIIALCLALAMVLSLAACGSKEPSISAADKLNKLPTQQEKQETPEKTEKPEQPEAPAEKAPAQSKPNKEKPGKTDKTEPEAPADPEPSQGLDAYDNPCDHPHEGTDLTVYDGIYKAKLAQGDDEETWLQIKGYNDFILLEYHGLQAGEIYRYWVEEFWPADGWYTDTDTDSVTGKSQQFTSMAQYENYSGLPQNRVITLTNDGVVLNYDDSDAEYFARDDGFDGGHNAPEELRNWFGEDSHLDFDYQYDAKDVVGTWGFWDGWQAVCMTFAEDGSFSCFWKYPNEPIQVYEGAYAFGEYSGNLEVLAERIGYGRFPVEANWQWEINEWGDLNLLSEEDVIFLGEYNFWPIEEDFFTVMDADKALGYVYSNINESDEYTDKYDSTYYYYYSYPQFYYSEHKDLQKINTMISDFYYPIIEAEFRAMEEGEILTYDHVDWQSAVYNGILFLHVYAYTYDWEEHDSFYIDLETMKQIDAKEVLKRLDIEEDFFLEGVRAYAEDRFVDTFSELEEEYREDYGYYDCLEQTVSDEFVNLDLPIFVDGNGNLCVYVKISSMAGSGLMWAPAWFYNESGTYEVPGAYVDDAVG